MHKGGWSIIIDELWDSINVNIKLRVAIFNSSNNQSINLNQLGHTVERQLKNSYEMSYISKRFQVAIQKSGLDNMPNRKFLRLVGKKITVKVSVQYRIITSELSRYPNELLIQIRSNEGKWRGLYGNAALGGSYLNLNESIVSGIIRGLDDNTIPHELGHSLGLLHVDEPDTYHEDARQYYPVKRQRTKDSLNAMFSGGSPYMHNLTSTVITPRQMDIVIENYRFGNLNR